MNISLFRSYFSIFAVVWAMALSGALTVDQEAQFNKAAYQVGYSSHALVAKYHNKAGFYGLSEYQKKQVTIVAEQADAIIEKVANLYKKGKGHEAVVLLAQQLSNLCQKLGIHTNATLFVQENSLQEQLIMVEACVAVLQKCYDAIVPKPSLLTKFFPNYVTIYTLPKGMNAVAKFAQWKGYAVFAAVAFSGQFESFKDQLTLILKSMSGKLRYALKYSHDELIKNGEESIKQLNQLKAQKIQYLSDHRDRNGNFKFDTKILQLACPQQFVYGYDKWSKNFELRSKDLSNTTIDGYIACINDNITVLKNNRDDKTEGISWIGSILDQLDKISFIAKNESKVKLFIQYAAWPFALTLASDYLYRCQKERYEAYLEEVKNAQAKQKEALNTFDKNIIYEREIGFAQLQGLADIKDQELGFIVDYLKHPLKYHGVQKKGTFTVLLYGPPGTGKTLSARAIAKESGAPFVEITADDIFSERAKDKIAQVCALAQKAAAERPEKSAIIYLDEIDCVSTNREKGHGEAGAGMAPDADRSKALANLLTLLDGVNAGNPYLHIVIIMTTNHWKSLDPALMRPGRIDRKVAISLPNEESRYQFLKALIVEPMEDDLLRDLAKKTAGYTGAYMVNMVNGAVLQALYRGKEVPSKEDYEAQIVRISCEIAATA